MLTGGSWGARIALMINYLRAGGMRFTRRPAAAALILFSFWISEVSSADKTPEFLTNIIENYPSVTFVRCPKEPQVVAVYGERDRDWWGKLAVYNRKGDTINWCYAYPKSYEEVRGHYIVRFRWVSLQQTNNPVLEVIESTHMGNGSLRLWEVDRRELRLLLETRVRGRCFSLPEVFTVPMNGEAWFEGPHLEIDYRPAPEMSSDSVILTGAIRIEDIAGKALPGRKYEQACLWDASKRLFVVQPPVCPPTQ